MSLRRTYLAGLKVTHLGAEGPEPQDPAYADYGGYRFTGTAITIYGETLSIHTNSVDKMATWYNSWKKNKAVRYVAYYDLSNGPDAAAVAEYSSGRAEEIPVTEVIITAKGDEGGNAGVDVPKKMSAGKKLGIGVAIAGALGLAVHAAK